MSGSLGLVLILVTRVSFTSRDETFQHMQTSVKLSSEPLQSPKNQKNNNHCGHKQCDLCCLDKSKRRRISPVQVVLSAADPADVTSTRSFSSKVLTMHRVVKSTSMETQVWTQGNYLSWSCQVRRRLDRLDGRGHGLKWTADKEAVGSITGLLPRHAPL